MTKSDKKPKSKARRIFDIIISVITGLLLAVIVICSFSVIISKLKGQEANLFGYRFIYIVTDSMEPELAVGSSILVKNCSADDVEVGDYVCFISEDPALAESSIKLITHMCVKEKYYDEDLKGYYILTQGIKEGAPIDSPVKADNVQGKFVSKTSVGFSKFISFLITPYGLVTLIALPLIASLALQLFSQIKNFNSKEKTKEELELEAIDKRTKEITLEAQKDFEAQKEEILLYIKTINEKKSSCDGEEKSKQD